MLDIHKLSSDILNLRNMSQQTVKRTTLSMWEIDKAEPDINTIVKILLKNHLF